MPIILLLALALRIPGLQRPLLGNFATRNVVQAMEARNWVRGDAPWWRPTLDVLADGQPAWHLVEVPCSAYLSGLLWRVFGGSLDAWGRATAIGWSLASVALLYSIVRRRLGENAAAAASLAMAIAPVSVIYGQSFLLEPSVTALSLAAWWGTENYLATRRFRWLAFLAAALAILWLSKIYMLLLAAPLLWLALRLAPEASAPGENRRSHADLFLSTQRLTIIYITLTFCLAALPVAWWSYQVWQMAGPNSVTVDRVYYSFLGSATEHRFPQPLLVAPEFYLGLARDLFTVVLTPIGALLLLYGARQVNWRRWWPLALVGVLLVILMPRKFHEMNYYHLLLLPALCATIGLGWKTLMERFPQRRALTVSLATLALVCSLRYSVRPAFVTPAEDRSVVAAAAALQRIAAPEDFVVTAHGSALDLLYYCDRRGWSLPVASADFAERLREFRSQGANWLVIAEETPLCLPVAAAASLEQLPVADREPGYRIYRLGESNAAVRSAASTAMPAAPGTR